MKTFTLTTLTALMVSQGAFAADIATPANDILPPVVKQQNDAWQASVGLAAAYVPEYEGANTNHWRALPLLDARRGGFFAGTARGIGYEFSPAANLAIGPRLSYRRGRDESDSPRLHGLGDVDGGAEAGAFFRYTMNGWFVRGDIRNGVGSGTDGVVATLGGGHAMKFGTGNQLILDVSADWADSKYTEAYFGVNPAQAAASGLSVYTPGGGIKRFDMGMRWMHTYNAGWFSSLGLRLGTLAGDAADSPIVERKQQTSVSAALGYRF